MRLREGSGRFVGRSDPVARASRHSWRRGWLALSDLSPWPRVTAWPRKGYDQGHPAQNCVSHRTHGCAGGGDEVRRAIPTSAPSTDRVPARGELSRGSALNAVSVEDETISSRRRRVARRSCTGRRSRGHRKSQPVPPRSNSATPEPRLRSAVDHAHRTRCANERRSGGVPGSG
jgi:hypothetical protein